MKGVANMDELRWLTHWIPNCSFLSFSPIFNATGKSAWDQ